MSSTPSQPKRRYRTTNCKQYSAALKARGSLTVWFDKNISWVAAASGKRGRSPKFSDAAIQFCLTIENLFGLALRQSTGLVQLLLTFSGLAWPGGASALPVKCSMTAPAGGFHGYQVSGRG